MQLSSQFVKKFIPAFALMQLFFSICKDGHWFVFVVAIRDGYFIFLDSFFGENDLFQEHARSVVVSYKHRIILFWELHIFFCSFDVFDFLKIPNFLKAWDKFIGYNYDFEYFVIHYAPVPKQDREYWSKHDDGIFVMKFLELWDPYVNMMAQFQSSNINDIRVKYVSNMVFNKHNELNGAKELISNFEAMVSVVFLCLKTYFILLC